MSMQPTTREAWAPRPHEDDRGVRLAELVAALSLGIDLGFGQPMEHILRQCLIALRLRASACPRAFGPVRCLQRGGRPR